jgi:hypothetical protein
MHPVAVDVDYTIERNRLTTFFRWIVAIPWFIWLSIYGLAAFVAAVIAWFALLFTKRYPDSLYRFVSGYIEVATQIGGFALLATDEWPPFTPREEPYPVRVDIAPQQVEYRRAHTFFKYLLAFPQQLLLQGISYLLLGGVFVAWWRILFTGKQSATMHDAIRVSLAYSCRANSFLLLLTETHPRLLDLPQQQFPADAPSLPGPQQMPQGQIAQGAPPAAPAA